MQRLKLVVLAALTTILASVAVVVFSTPPPARAQFHGSVAAARPALNAYREFQAIRQLAAKHMQVAATTYTVQSHDALTAIAKQVYGSARDWPELWWLNRKHIHNPNVVVAGTVLQLHGSHPSMARMQAAAMAAIPKPKPLPTKHHWASPASQPQAQIQPQAAPQPQPQTGGSLQAYAESLVGAAQFACVNAIFTRESGWNPSATNPTSGAYGIPQALPGSKMASAGADWQTNPLTQIRWGIGYMDATYGSPCNAWAFWQANGSY